MKIRIATVAIGVTAGLLVAATPPDGFSYVEESTTIYNAIQCVTEGSSPSCVSTDYELSTGPGDNSVGTTFTATPIGSALYYADGETYSYQTFKAKAGVLGRTFIADAARDVTGQVELRGWVGVNVAVDAAVAIQLNLRYEDEATGKMKPLRLEAEVEKIVMAAPGDNVFEYTIDLPDMLDGVEVTIADMGVAQRGVNVLTSGFMDGEGESFFEFPSFRKVEDAA